ncbi:MAG: hypothetical protein AAGI88_10035 [Pseudomonadota bacterium]
MSCDQKQGSPGNSRTEALASPTRKPDTPGQVQQPAEARTSAWNRVAADTLPAHAPTHQDCTLLDDKLDDKLENDPRLESAVRTQLEQFGFVSVIVSIRHAKPIAALSSDQSPTRDASRPTSLRIDPRALAQNEKRYSEARDFFSSQFWHSEPVFIESASAVAVEVTTEQLCTILEEDFVELIALNQRRVSG